MYEIRHLIVLVTLQLQFWCFISSLHYLFPQDGFFSILSLFIAISSIYFLHLPPCNCGGHSMDLGEQIVLQIERAVASTVNDQLLDPATKVQKFSLRFTCLYATHICAPALTFIRNQIAHEQCLSLHFYSASDQNNQSSVSGNDGHNIQIILNLGRIYTLTMYGCVACGLVFRMRDSLGNFIHGSIANSICAFWLVHSMWCCVYMRCTVGNYVQNRGGFNYRKFRNYVQSRW